MLNDSDREAPAYFQWQFRGAAQGAQLAFMDVQEVCVRRAWSGRIGERGVAPGYLCRSPGGRPHPAVSSGFRFRPRLSGWEQPEGEGRDDGRDSRNVGGLTGCSPCAGGSKTGSSAGASVAANCAQLLETE